MTELQSQVLECMADVQRQTPQLGEDFSASFLAHLLSRKYGIEKTDHQLDPVMGNLRKLGLVAGIPNQAGLKWHCWKLSEAGKSLTGVKS